jgi:homoserine dehydrogenase
MKKIPVGLLGYGTIGQGVIKLLSQHARLIEDRLGARLTLAGVADPDLKRPRKVKVAKRLLTSDPYRLIRDPKIPLIVELIGDWPGVKEMILAAIRAGKSVVTANKALLAKHGSELFAEAKKHRVDIYYEASVAGGVPIIRTLREGLIANQIQAVYGIVNGTCNYILTEMSRRQGDFQTILKEAQAAGYAEANPAADVEGYDASHKLALLIRLGFGVPIQLSQIFREGITALAPADFEAAAEFGFAIKLLAIAKLDHGRVEARVHPTLIPAGSLLAGVGGVFNAVYVVGDFVGPTLYYGRGAGMDPTASAVVSDLMELARNYLDGRPGRRLPSGSFQDSRPQPLRVMPAREVVSQYYLRLQVKDRPGVLSAISGVLAKERISISAVAQRGPGGKTAPIVMLTHSAPEAAMVRALSRLNRLAVVQKPIQRIRIETSL